MKVSELIEVLSEYNQDATVSIHVSGVIDTEDIGIGFISNDCDDMCKMNAKQLWIEGL